MDRTLLAASRPRQVAPFGPTLFGCILVELIGPAGAVDDHTIVAKGGLDAHVTRPYIGQDRFGGPEERIAEASATAGLQDDGVTYVEKVHAALASDWL